MSGLDWVWLGIIFVAGVAALVYALWDWNKPKGPR